MTTRVLQIIPTLDRGGAEKQLSLLASGLPRDRFDTHVAVLTRTGPYEASLRAADVPYEIIGKHWKVDPGAWWRLRKLIRRLQPEIVHTWLFAANCYGRHAALCERSPHVIAGERCVDPWKSGYELWIDRRLAARSDTIVTNSSGVVDFYAEHGIDRDRFTVIPNGVDPAVTEGGPDREAICEQLEIAPEAHLIAAVGRMWPQKRYKDLIWATELLRAGRRDETHLLIFGDGPQRERLEDYAEQVGVAERVHFLGARPDAASWLPACDCYWLASGYEGQSNALMEAMCAGLPVVASDIPGNRDLVEHDQSGWLVPVGDAAGFARAANVLFERPEIAEPITTAAQQRMRTHFTTDRMIDRHAQLYAKLVDP